MAKAGQQHLLLTALLDADIVQINVLTLLKKFVEIVTKYHF